MSRERFLVRAVGPNEDAVRKGLRKIGALLETLKSAVIVVPMLRQLSGSVLIDVLGETASKVLLKDREITLPNGATLQLCSAQTLKNFSRADAYLVLWGSAPMIQDVESLSRWQACVVVTWAEKDSQDWEEQHTIQVL